MIHCQNYSSLVSTRPVYWTFGSDNKLKIQTLNDKFSGKRTGCHQPRVLIHPNDALLHNQVSNKPFYLYFADISGPFTLSNNNKYVLVDIHFFRTISFYFKNCCCLIFILFLSFLFLKAVRQNLLHMLFSILFSSNIESRSYKWINGRARR